MNNYTYTPRVVKSIFIAMLAIVLAAGSPGCTANTAADTQGQATTPGAAAKHAVQVQKQDLVINIPVDGNLVMPQAFDLHFGTSGDVREVLVTEGDRVKAGAILARLDDTAQRLDIKAANNSVQQTLSNLYETVPRLPQFPTKFWDMNTATAISGPSSTTNSTTSNESVVVTTTSTPNGTPLVITVVGPIDGAITPLSDITTTTTTGSTPGTAVTTTIRRETTSTVVTTTTAVVTAGLNPAVDPTITTTTVRTDNRIDVKNTLTTTTATATLIEKPRWDYKWNNATQQWIQDPNVPNNTGLPVGYPGYYANSTALTSYNWASGEVDAAQKLYAAENYTAASSELYIAMADLEASLMILEDAALNPDSGIGNIAPYVPEDLTGIVEMGVMLDQPFAIYYVQEIRSAKDTIRQGQADIEKLRGLIDEGKYDEADALFGSLLTQMQSIGKTVMKNINIIEKRTDTDIYGRDISFKLYDAAEVKLNAALKGIESGGLESPGLSDNLRIAEHYIQLCNGILGTNDYVLQHGLSLKSENEYKIDLNRKVIDLSNKRDDFLKTVIMSPVDGIVVSVGAKQNDVLSAQDYSSKGTIQVVDTSQIKFSGTVDEIDILKIKSGQKATISVDAYPNKYFEGTVSFISPYGTTNSTGVVKFNITILLDPTDTDLKGGLTATAKINVNTVKDALVVPLTALSTDDQGSYVTLLLDEAAGTTEKRYVTLGSENEQYVQVVSGLNEGDKVKLVETVSNATIITRPTYGGSGGSGTGGPPH